MSLQSLSTTEKMNLIYELKQMGIPQSEVRKAFENRGYTPPTAPTIRKYYNTKQSVSTEHMAHVYAKKKAFDEPHCKTLILQTFKANGPEITVSSLYDLLQERLVATGILQKLPGNEQTLRNYCHYLKKERLVEHHQKPQRVYDEVKTPAAGVQLQLDYGVQNLGNSEQFHFIALLLRHSRVLFVKGQDHRFNASETCTAIYAFFMLLGGRVREIVIDQDACLVHEEIYGEITTTRVFTDFLLEQDLKLFVCRKADPETKGPVENTVKFVKQNYLSSRMDQPLQDLIANIPEWCKRKNSRIHAGELWKIDDHFNRFEKQCLLPLLPSQYDRIGLSKIQISVSKTRQARYRTNRYTLPRNYYQPHVWAQVTNAKIMFYEDKESLLPICSYDLPSRKVKNHHFEHEEFKKKPSTAYRDVYDRILSTWYAPELKHYLNGLHKKHENSRFLRDQFMGFEKMLSDRNPSPEELAAVMDIACQGFRYKVSQLKEVWDSYLLQHTVTISTKNMLGNRQYDHQVSKRDTKEYAEVVTQMVEVAT